MVIEPSPKRRRRLRIALWIAVPLVIWGAVMLTVGILFGPNDGGADIPQLSRADLEQQVTVQLVKMSGRAPDAVHCDGNLLIMKGDKRHCVVTKGDHTAGLTVIASDVSADKHSVRVSLMADEPLSQQNDS